MEKIKKLIANGSINNEFYNCLKSFTHNKDNVTHLPRILSYLYSQSSLQSKLKAKDEAFISTLIECVVLLITCSLSSKDVQTNEQLRASCLRNASNFSVILHQEGYENNTILDSTVACVVSMIDSNISWSSEELHQSLANLRSMVSRKLSTQGPKLSLADQHSVWNQLIILYKPIKDKTKLISFLREVAFSKSQPIGDVFYLETSAHVFTRSNLTDLFGILDNYYIFAWKSQDTSGIYKVASTILDEISTEINSDKDLKGNENELELSCISVYKHLHEITHHITRLQSESVMCEYFTRFATYLNNLVSLAECVTSQKTNPEDSNQKTVLCQKTLTSILIHLSFFQLKHLNVFVKTETIHTILNMYKLIFHLAQLVRTEDQYTCQKQDNMLYLSWYSCQTIIGERLTLTPLHKMFTEVLKCINNFIGNMFVLLYSKNAVNKDDGYDLENLLCNLGKLSQLILKLDAGHVNRNLSTTLLQWLLEVFPKIPDKYAMPVVDYVINIGYNCVKTCLPAADATSLLTILEPIVTLCIMKESCVPNAVRTWVRVQYQYKQEHTDYKFIHLCDHIDRILPQLRAKYPTVSFVNTSGVGFVSRVLKCELDEVLTYRQMEDNTSTSYASVILRRVLHLTQTLPQDLTLADICLSTLHLTYNLHEPTFSEMNSKLKAYVIELKQKLWTNENARSTSLTNGNIRLSKALDPNNSELETSEQSLVTEHTCACLLLANYYVVEHFEKVAKKRATVKKSKPAPDGKDQKQKRTMNDLDKGIEMATHETNVFPTSMDIRETEELIRILDKVALVLSKVVQSDVALDLDKVSSITRIDRMVSYILYVGYSYRIYLEKDKEIEFWKLSLQLSVLLQQDTLYVECVSNLLWLDEGLRPNHLLRTDELVSATLKPSLPPHVKTLYQFARIKQALSLNQTSEASTNLSEMKLEHSPVPTAQEMLLQYYYWYLKCQILMKKSDPTPMEHAYIVACCEEAFRCLFKNYSTVSLTSPVVIHVICCYLNITLLVTRFHTVHLNPTEGRCVLGAVLIFTQELCLPLWTAQLLSLSAGLDVITCNKDDLFFKTNCLEQVLIHKSNSGQSHTAPLTPRVNASSNLTKHHFTPSRIVGQELTRDAVVTMTTVEGSSLASPRFASTVSNKLPSFIAHRSCQCFECRNSVYQELLISLGLLQGLYYQLDENYEMTRFCFQNAEHLLNKLKILKGLPEDVATEWQSRLLFYRANLEGILCHPTKLLELNQELQAMDNGGSYDYKHFEFLWQQEQYLMFVSASLESQTKAGSVLTPTSSRRSKSAAKRASLLPAQLLKTPKVQNINVHAIPGMNTVYPAVKFKETMTHKTKVRPTLTFDEDEEEEKEHENTGGKEKKDGNDKEPDKRSGLNAKNKDIPATPCSNSLTVQGGIKGEAMPKTLMKTTVGRSRRVKWVEPVIVKENKENDCTPPPPQAPSVEGMTGKTNEKCQYYTARTTLTSTRTHHKPACVTDTPSVFATPYTGCADPTAVVSPRSSQTADKRKKAGGNRRKVLFDESDEDDKDGLNPIAVSEDTHEKDAKTKNDEYCFESETKGVKSYSRSNRKIGSEMKFDSRSNRKIGSKETKSSSVQNVTKTNRTTNRVVDALSKSSKIEKSTRKTVPRRKGKSELEQAQESGSKTDLGPNVHAVELDEVVANVESLQISEREEDVKEQNGDELNVSSVSSHYHSFSSTPDRMANSLNAGIPTDTISLTSSISSDIISISSTSSGISRCGFTNTSSSERSERSSRSSKDSIKSSASSRCSTDSIKSSGSSKYSTSSCSVNSYNDFTMENIKSIRANSINSNSSVHVRSSRTSKHSIESTKSNSINSCKDSTIDGIKSTRSCSISSSLDSNSTFNSTRSLQESRDSSVKSTRSNSINSCKDSTSGATKSTRSSRMNSRDSISSANSLSDGIKDTKSRNTTKSNQSNKNSINSIKDPSDTNKNSIKESSDCTTKFTLDSNKHLVNSVKDSSNSTKRNTVARTDGGKSSEDYHPNSSTCSSVILPSRRGRCRKILDSSSDSSVSSQTSTRNIRMKSQKDTHHKKTDTNQIRTDNEKLKTDNQKLTTENLNVKDKVRRLDFVKTKTENQEINSDTNKIKNGILKTKSDRVKANNVHTLTKQINSIEIVENDENQASNNIVEAAEEHCRSSRKVVSKAAFDDHEFAVPAPNPLKRKPRPQFPKNPFIF